MAFDCIVLGVGGFGSGALYHLARRGVRVLGIDRFVPPHGRGSSHGESRIIRQAYFEHPDYVPLCRRACELWRELESETGRDLMRLCGLLIVGPPDGEAVPGANAAARQHGVTIENLSRAEAAARFPTFGFPEASQAVYEPVAGYLHVEECLAAHIERAVAHGAELLTNEIVHEWSVSNGEVAVVTNRGRYTAARLIITAGPWASRVLADLGVPLCVVRKPQLWLPADEGAYDV
ncbi:MAG: N-methyl-L-tryptophan oxidase, partial [Planctomycetes bacterium]|nr:N-methyl-L-tryptophan oxidase [Planctomycetota bacterium]